MKLWCLPVFPRPLSLSIEHSQISTLRKKKDTNERLLGFDAETRLNLLGLIFEKDFSLTFEIILIFSSISSMKKEEKATLSLTPVFLGTRTLKIFYLFFFNINSIQRAIIAFFWKDEQEKNWNQDSKINFLFRPSNQGTQRRARLEDLKVFFFILRNPSH